MSDFIKSIKSRLVLPGGMEFIEKEIELLYKAIEQTHEIHEADLIFKNLEDIQFILAQAVFKDGIKISPFLRQFVYDFDRIDDIEVKEYQYKKIKQQSK
jgi:hypothetical protein